MSDDQNEGQPENSGSRLAQMFGYVTPEDRSKWQQQRTQNQGRVSATKKGAKSTLGSMMEFGERNMRSKLDAAHRVAAQKKFDETHSKTTTRHADPRTRSIIETVDYSENDTRQSIDSDMEIE
jgi:hypothetical protein